MYKLGVLVLSLVALATSLPTPGRIEVVPKNVSSRPSPFALSGWTDYSVATVENIDFPGCSSAPCALTMGQQVTMVIDFRPRDYHCCLDHRAILMQESALSVLSDGPAPMDPINAGQLYQLTYTFTPNANFRGLSELRFSLHQNYVHELHVVIPVNLN